MAALFISRADRFDGDYSIKRRATDALPGANDARLAATEPETLHYHDFYEIQIFCAEAPGERLGTAVLDDDVYELRHGDIFLVPIFGVHSVQMNSPKGCVRYGISLSPAFMMQSGSGNSNLFAIYNKASDNYPLRHMSAEDVEKFQELCREYERRAAALAHGGKFLEQAFLFQILALVYDLCYEETPVDPTDALHRDALTNLVRYIDAHIAEDLSLSRLAAVSNFSVYHLCRVFKKDMGVTLNQYIMSRRIENAKILLGGQISIQNISKRAGFNNYNHFYRCFRQNTGVSPVEYRKFLAAEKKGKENRLTEA